MSDISKVSISNITYDIKDAVARSSISSMGSNFLPRTGGTMTGELVLTTPLALAYGGTGGTDSGWVPVTNSSVFSGTIYYRSVGSFLEVTGNGLKLASSLSATNYRTLFTLPSDYIPEKTIDGMCDTIGDALNVRAFGLRINSSGEVNLLSNGSAIPTTISLNLCLFGFLD